MVALATLLLLGSTACANFWDMNVDPNNVTTADPQLLLTNVQWEFCRRIDKDPMYVTRVLVQADGESNLVNYRWNRWDFNAYRNPLKNIEKMREEAEREGKSGYIALAHFLRAFTFFDITMTFGDIPYSEALKGESEDLYTPKYDTQKEVFQGILAELDQATKIVRAMSPGERIAGDIYYGGDPTLWLKGIQSFKLKVLMMLSNRAEEMPELKSQFAQIVRTGEYIQKNSENMGLPYLDRQDNRYPMFNDSGFGSGMYMDSTFVALLREKEDPRLFTFVTQTKNALDEGKAIDDFTSYDGGNPILPYSTVNDKAVAGNISKPHTRYYQSPTNEPRVLIGATEVQMLIAEGILRGWVEGNAQEHYAKGIAESFDFYATHVPEYSGYLSPEDAARYAKHPQVTLEGVRLEEQIKRVVTQTYITHYFSGQWTGYQNYLRTGYPEFLLPEGVRVPTRWMYPNSEYNNNAQHVQAAIERQFGTSETIHSPMWWLGK